MQQNIIAYKQFEHLAYGDTSSAGIYALRNTLNGREYVGNSLVAVYGRWKKHLMLLYRGMHHCKALQADWGIYATQFEFTLLEPMENYNFGVYERERYWINNSNASHPAYNSVIPRLYGGGDSQTTEEYLYAQR